MFFCIVYRVDYVVLFNCVNIGDVVGIGSRVVVVV